MHSSSQPADSNPALQPISYVSFGKALTDLLSSLFHFLTGRKKVIKKKYKKTKNKKKKKKKYYYYHTGLSRELNI